MKINILMSTYNGEKYLAQQIESIQKQTITDWKLLIRDDGSTDNTPQIIKEFVDKDSRIIFINENNRENFGVIKNFYTLVKYEVADFYFFSDQDDYWLPNKLEVTLNEASNYDPQLPLLVYTDLSIVDGDLHVIRDSMIRFQSYQANTSLVSELTENTVTGGTALINDSLAKLWTVFDDLLMHDWYLALIAAAKGNLVYLDTPTELYRQHENNVLGARTWTKRMKSWTSPSKSLKKYWWLITSSQQQARHLLELDLNHHNRELVASYVSLVDQTLSKRLALIKKFGYRKNRAFHTFVFRTLIITKLGYRRK
ncbi:glycosyltransferase family 2 protein [Streptococcus hongkongensis]|nr:alpha-L-Rha alpha-1,3-L-rhamnosyltransferase [Streptococcus uberis]